MTAIGLRRIISATRHLLLDFDGPVCSVFAGTAASEVAGQLRHTLQAAGFTLPAQAAAEPDPLEVFRLVADVGPEAASTAQQLLTVFETRAVATARPTPGSADLIITTYRTGRTVSIVSNNSSAAISAYLADHRLDGYIRAVFGRDGANPDLMKPSPYRVRQAVGSLGADPGECVLVGDSPTDVVAGRLAGVRVIGYANKPGKIDALAHARADAVTTDLSAITSAVRSAPRVPLPNWAVFRSSGAAVRRRPGVSAWLCAGGARPAHARPLLPRAHRSARLIGTAR